MKVLRHGIIHHQQVRQCVYQSRENVIMDHYDEVIQIVAVHRSIDHVRYVEQQ